MQSLDEIAKESFVDKTYVCRLFQRFDQQTPYQYLTRLKMNKAAELLEDSTMLIKEISAAFGYDDPFHFSRIFKNVLGISPKEFRRLRRACENTGRSPSDDTGRPSPTIFGAEGLLNHKVGARELGRCRRKIEVEPCAFLGHVKKFESSRRPRGNTDRISH